MLSQSLLTLIAAEVILAGARVKTTDGVNAYNAGAADVEIGTALLHSGKSSYAIGEGVSVALQNDPRTRTCIASGAFAAGAIVRRAASGKVDDGGPGASYGIALEAAVSDGDMVEVLSGGLILKGIRSIVIPLGTLATTGATSVTIPVPDGGTLVGAKLCAKAALAANDTNYLTFAMTNKGQAGAGSTAMLSATDSGTTKATGGAAIAAYTTRDLPLHATAANAVVAANDCLELSLTATGTLNNTVTEATVRLDFAI